METMKINRALPAMFCAFLLLGCNEEIEISDAESYARVYMPQAVDYPAARTLVMADTIQHIVYGAAYGGLGYPAADLEVRFSIDPSLVSEFNAANGTDYALLPEGSYELETGEATIPAGRAATAPLALKIKTLGYVNLNQQYLLPVRMELDDASVGLNPGLSTTWFLISGTLAELNRSAWSVEAVSSEETEGEGAGNGRAVHALDGDASTFWHTQWAGGQPGHPHSITIDMGQVQALQGLFLLPRQEKFTGNPMKMLLEVSLDGTNWEEAGNFSIENTTERHTLFLEAAKEAHFFRITVQQSHGDTFFTHLAEIGAF